MPNNNTRKRALGERLANIANYHSKSASAERERLKLEREIALLPMRNEPSYWESASANTKKNNAKRCNQKNAPKPKFNQRGKPTNAYTAWRKACGLLGGKRKTRKTPFTFFR